jgi:hypothetical protein
MVKTLNDYTTSPGDVAYVFLLHEGDFYPGPNRRHLLQAYQGLYVPPYYSAFIYFPSPLIIGDPPKTALDLAIAGAQILAALPNVIQDLCYECHPDRARPNRPRWNIYHAGPFHTIVPVFIEDWF